jgi:hypothetical protein
LAPRGYSTRYVAVALHDRDTKPAPADTPVELVHLTSEDAETAEEPEDAPANVVPMKRGRRPARPQD